MANIDKELNKIKHAIYGKDVRGSIHDGIDKVNKESEESKGKSDKAIKDSNKAKIDSSYAVSTSNKAISVANTSNDKSDDTQQQLDNIVLDSGTSDAEVIQARGNEPLLKDRLNKTDQKLAETATKMFDNKITSHTGKKVYMSFIDDDGRSEFYDKWKPIIENKKIPVTCALVTSRIDTDSNFMTLEQIKELDGLGVEFVSHTHTHPHLNTLTESELRLEFSESKNWLNDNGFSSDVLVTPYGSQSALTRKVSREYFSCVIDTLEGINTPPLSTYRIRRKGWFEDGKTTIAEHLSEVDTLVENGGWLIWKTHSQYTNFVNGQLDAVNEVIDYARSLGVEIVNASEGLRKNGNLVDAGDVEAVGINYGIVDINGVAYGQLGGARVMAGKDLIDMNVINEDINNFQEGCTTTLQFNSDDVAGLSLPENEAGQLEVFRGSSNYHGTQTYHVYSSSRKYFRYWSEGRKEWDGWAQLNPLKYIGFNAVTPDTLPTSLLLRNQITITYIDTANATGFPENKAGQLLTYALHTASKYPNQEYKIYGSNITYRRYLDHDEWSDWETDPTLVKSNLIDVPFGEVPAGEVRQLTIPLVGAKLGDQIIVTPRNSIDISLLWFGSIDANDSIRIKVFNAGTTNIDASRKFDVIIIKQ